MKEHIREFILDNLAELFWEAGSVHGTRSSAKAALGIVMSHLNGERATWQVDIAAALLRGGPAAHDLAGDILDMVLGPVPAPPKPDPNCQEAPSDRCTGSLPSATITTGRGPAPWEA